MKTEMMNLSELQMMTSNVRRHPAAQIQELKRSLEMFGQVRPVVVDETNTILAGHGLVLAMRELGWIQAEIWRLSQLTARQKKKLLIADNRIYELGFSNRSEIEQLLEEFAQAAEFDIPGFDESILAAILQLPTIETEAQNYGKISADLIAKKEQAQKQLHPVEVPVSNEQQRAIVKEEAPMPLSSRKILSDDQSFQSTHLKVFRRQCPYCKHDLPEDF